MEFPTNLCRLCANIQAETIDLRSNHDLTETLGHLLTVKISADDPLPKAVCTYCVKMVHLWIEFKSNCIKKEQLFQEMINLCAMTHNEVPQKNNIMSNAHNILPIESSAGNCSNSSQLQNLMPSLNLVTCQSSSSEEPNILSTKHKDGMEEIYVVQKNFPCYTCNENFLTDTALQTHITSIHLTNMELSTILPNTIPQSIKETTSDIIVNKAMLMAVANQQFLCLGCTNYFSTIEALQNHSKTFHSANPVACYKFCTVCEDNVVFHTSDEYLQHENKHKITSLTHEGVYDDTQLNGDNRDSFDASSDASSSRDDGQEDSNLPDSLSYEENTGSDMQHQMSGQSRKDGLKCWVCNRSFRKKGWLIQHIKLKHIFQNDDFCPICSKSFTSEAYVHRHMLEVHKKGIHNCPVCRKGFAGGSQFAKHMSDSHSDLKHKFPCPHCPTKYKYLSKLKRHLKTSHNRNYLSQSSGKEL